MSQTVPLPSTSLDTSDRLAAEDVQIPQSARSTLTGRSWLSDSKWSDEEDDESAAGGPSFGQLGAIPKTSGVKLTNQSANNNNNIKAAETQRRTTAAADASIELIRNDAKQVLKVF